MYESGCKSTSKIDKYCHCR